LSGILVREVLVIASIRFIATCSRSWIIWQFVLFSSKLNCNWFIESRLIGLMGSVFISGFYYNLLINKVQSAFAILNLFILAKGLPR